MLTATIARELLDYNPATGVFMWRVDRHKHKAGTRAGVVEQAGYRRIKTGGKHHAAHRLAYLWMTGEWPLHEVDHINMDRDDNRWANLRSATSSENRANTRVRPTNRSGLKGVSRRDPNPVRRRASTVFEASIRKDGKRIHLGNYSCPVAAHFAYIIAAERLHGAFARSA